MGKPGEKPSEHKRDQLQQLYTYMSCKFENQHGAIPCRGLCHAGGAGGYTMQGAIPCKWGYTMQVFVCVCVGGGVLYHAGGYTMQVVTRPAI